MLRNCQGELSTGAVDCWLETGGLPQCPAQLAGKLRSGLGQDERELSGLSILADVAKCWPLALGAV